MAIIEKKYQINISHVRKTNSLSNRGILDLLESIACYHSDKVGYGMANIHETNSTWVLLHWKVQVFKRLPYLQNVIVKTWARPCSKVSTLRDFEIYDENHTLLCKASSKWAFIDLTTNHIAKITPELLQLYAPEEKSVFAEDDIAKLRLPELPASPCFTFPILRKDIDVNHHMHNTFYLDYAYEALPQNIYESDEANYFEIMYKTGATLGNQVNCYYVQEEASHFIVMKSLDNSQLHAIIKLQQL